MTLNGIFDLSKKKAIVTGGAVGVGRACATALAMAGADVAIVGRTRVTAERACVRLKEFGVDAFFWPCDVSQPDQVESMTREVVSRFGRIDIGINNAGGSPEGAALALGRDEWRQTLNTNLSGVFWCAQAQARQMVTQRPRGGKIINIASIYAAIAGGNCAYNTSKAGVVHLTRSLAAELGGENINVNCISPGWILTPGNPIPSELRQRMRDVTPMGSLVRYQDMYGAVIYLASAASNLVTGQELTVDGGHTLNTWVDPLRRNVVSRTTPEEEEIERNEDLWISRKLE